MFLFFFMDSSSNSASNVNPSNAQDSLGYMSLESWAAKNNVTFAAAMTILNSRVYPVNRGRAGGILYVDPVAMTRAFNQYFTVKGIKSETTSKEAKERGQQLSELALLFGITKNPKQLTQEEYSQLLQKFRIKALPILEQLKQEGGS